jgi:hypothetical protein
VRALRRIRDFSPHVERSCVTDPGQSGRQSISADFSPECWRPVTRRVTPSSLKWGLKPIAGRTSRRQRRAGDPNPVGARDDTDHYPLRRSCASMGRGRQNVHPERGSLLQIDPRASSTRDSGVCKLRVGSRSSCVAAPETRVSRRAVMQVHSRSGRSLRIWDERPRPQGLSSSPSSIGRRRG